VDLFDAEAAERVASELDRIVERRAREARDTERVEEMWAESVRLYNGHRRETNREAWRAYHLNQADRLEATAAELARDHRARAEALLGERPGKAFEVESLSHYLQQGVRDAGAAYAQRKYWTPQSGASAKA
jgi:hypothetical protein